MVVVAELGVSTVVVVVAGDEADVSVVLVLKTVLRVNGGGSNGYGEWY